MTAPKKVLVLISEHPSPPNSGTRVKNFHFWKHFRNLGVELKILYTDERHDRPAFSSFEEIRCRFDRPSLPMKAWRYLNYSHHQYKFSHELIKKIHSLCQHWRPDIIHAEELKMAKYFPNIGIKQTLTVHNVESELLKMSGSLPFPFAQRLFDTVHAVNLKSYEKAAISQADLVFTYSEIDSKKLKALYPFGVFQTGQNGVNAQDIPATEVVSKGQILFVGSLHYAPNAQGLKWFIDQVFPLLDQSITINVAGAGAPMHLIEEMKKKNIVFHDSPESLESIYQGSTLTIVPILSGSGTRTKILESLAYQRLVISTTKGAEGLNVDESQGVFRADTKEDFSKLINHWANHAVADKGIKLGLSGRRYVLDKYDWSALAKKYLMSWSSL